ncbi:MAG: PilT/PilU family type 4a pilus ATPase [Clostridia bacterium]|nr:PilT/PilU family type 4a pilus ATPase [Clostridia bacterium]
MTFLEAVKLALEKKASDLFIIAGQPLTYKVGTDVIRMDDKRIGPEDSDRLVTEAYALARRDIEMLKRTGDDDYAVTVSGVSRMRVNCYKQRGSLAAVVRIVPFGIPDYRELGIIEPVIVSSDIKQGMVLVSGTAGSGKSTTLACIIDRINHTREGHIITLEDPIEYLYRNDRCIISQREVRIDTADYVTAIRSSLRQAPDVILLGEMRDYETIRTGMTAAETGHLVLSTLHTRGAANTVDRIIDIFPPNQQQQIRVQLAFLLQEVISEQLLPSTDGGVVPAFEVMVVNNAVKNLIRDSKLHQIDSVIATSAAEGMISMDNSIAELYKNGRITKETAIGAAMNPDMMIKRLC